MRHQLKHLEGKLVAWAGWETSQRHNKTWLCIAKARVVKWDGFLSIQQALKKNKPSRVDHLWLRGDDEECLPQMTKTYENVCGIGYVRKYKRKNGSWDYSVAIPSKRMSIEEACDLWNTDFEAKTPAERKKLLDQILLEIEDYKANRHEAIIYGVATSFECFEKQVLEQKEVITRTAEATEKALKTATMNGKCKGVNVLNFAKCQSNRPKGF